MSRRRRRRRSPDVEELAETVRAVDRAIAESVFAAGLSPPGVSVDEFADQIAELVALGAVSRVWNPDTGEIGLRIVEGGS